MGDTFITIIGIVVLIIQIIVIIKFFKLANDVAAVKNSMIKTSTDLIIEHNKLKMFGHSEKAREVLEEYIWLKFIYLKENYERQGRKYHYEQIKLDIEPKLIEVGGTWPDIEIENL